MPFPERYRLLFNRRGNDWWSIVFGYPVARLLVVFVEGWGWVTPGLLTLAGFVCKLAAAAVLWTGEGLAGPWLLPLLLQAAQVLDSMDGTLARARRRFSLAGAFLDKATDAIGFSAIAIALGRHAGRVTGDPLLSTAGGIAGAAFLAICYLHWMARAMLEPASKAGPLAGGGPPLSWGDIWREWLGGWRRIWRFGEADLYLWISCFALAGAWGAAVWFLCLVQSIGLLYMLVHLWRKLRRVDHG